jgi:hypothetical protein
MAVTRTTTIANFLCVREEEGFMGVKAKIGDIKALRVGPVPDSPVKPLEDLNTVYFVLSNAEAKRLGELLAKAEPPEITIWAERAPQADGLCRVDVVEQSHQYADE